MESEKPPLREIPIIPYGTQRKPTLGMIIDSKMNKWRAWVLIIVLLMSAYVFISFMSQVSSQLTPNGVGTTQPGSVQSPMTPGKSTR